MNLTTPVKQKFPRADAIAVARELVASLQPLCEPDRIKVAGSLRRGRAEVGDVEIVYVPRMVEVQDGLFDTAWYAATDLVLLSLVGAGVLRARENVKGGTAWGAKNKLALHVPSGIPVDFFATTEEAWWNYLVCRTGGAASNLRIASAAQARGWKWNPYGPGFTDDRGDVVRVKSERDAFELLGLKYLEPWER